MFLELLGRELSKLPDLERFLSRINAGNIKVAEFLMVIDSFEKIDGIIKNLSAIIPPKTYFIELFNGIPEFASILKALRTSFDIDLARKEGHIVPAAGIDENYDCSENELLGIQHQLQMFLKEQERLLGCIGKFKYKDLGKELYQLEVPSSVKVPSDYMLMSKTKSVNRYWTPAIKNLVRQFQEAEVKRAMSLQTIYSEVLKRFCEHNNTWKTIISVIAEIDCFVSLSKFSLSLSEPKCRPLLSNRLENQASSIEFEDLRHPCIPPEKEASFISNSVYLGPNSSRIMVLTGPNMGGKSTLLRQTCLGVILAQIGCFVPAKRCRLTPIDRIFTRLGANDNILAGQSTFMVEMLETSRILQEATADSLVILDELGRGTSTFDGLAIAQAVMTYLLENTQCLGLFATHYRKLAVDIDGHRCVDCRFMACQTDSDRNITFLYKLQPGISPKSYGMNVALLAGIPIEVINEAELVASQFEASLSLSDQNMGHDIIKSDDLEKLLVK